MVFWTCQNWKSKIGVDVHQSLLDVADCHGDLQYKKHVSYVKKPSYSPLYWLVYRDPCIGLLKSPYNWVV